ncbi:MAG: FAD-dependent oxidoreductase [Thermoanaerobaculia bacterium]
MNPRSLRAPDRPLRIAIVGAGPAGFYTAAALLASDAAAALTGGLHIDLLDRLPTPYGLVRYGVAPDHPKIKEVVRVFERVALDPRVRFLGNVEVGANLPVTELRSAYEQVVFSIGGQSDRRLGVAGEDLAGSHSSTSFVAWYNSHPDFADLPVDLSVTAAAVIGAGNVAVDVARILGRNPEDLAPTDISAGALECLRTSGIRDVHLLIRRGPVQAKWSPAELKELAHLPDVDLVVDPRELDLDPECALELAEDPQAQKGFELLRAAADRGPTGAARRIHLRFRISPVAVTGDDGRVTGIRLERNRLVGPAGARTVEPTGEVELLPVGLVVRAVGYRSLPMAGLPFDERRAIVPNERGRVVDPATGAPLAGLYVAGWVKRGPTGLIGSNKADGVETAAAMIEDWPEIASAPDSIDSLLAARGLRPVDFAQWKILDRLESENGATTGRPRVKFGRVEEMLAALRRSE